MTSSGQPLFLVVEFTEDDPITAAAVPSNWVTTLSENKGVCLWPKKYHFILVKNRVQPSEDWSSFDVKILYKTDKYDEARQKAKQCEYTSDLHSSSKEKGKGKRMKLICQSSEDDRSLTKLTSRNQKRKKPSKAYNVYSTDEDISSLDIPSPPKLITNKSANESSSDSPKLHDHSSRFASQSSTVASRSRKDKDNESESDFPKRFERSSRSTHHSSIALHSRRKHDNESSSDSCDSAKVYYQSSRSGQHSSSVSHSGKKKETVSGKNFCLKDKVTAMERNILFIKNEMSRLFEFVDAIMQNRGNCSSNVNEGTENILEVFPLSNMKQLKDLELKLETEPGYKCKMINALKMQGGLTLNDSVKRLLRLCFSDELACRFSWAGKKGKEKLCDLLITDSIFSAVRSQALPVEITTQKLEQSMKEHFRHAPARARKVTKEPEINTN